MTNFNQSDAPQKILLLSLSGIGNYLMHTPVFEALKKTHPNWHLTVWVAPRGTKELAENNPHINEVIEAPIKNNLTGHFQMINTLRQQKFDIGIVLFPGQLLKSAAYLYLSGIPKRIGHRYPLLSNQTSDFLLTQVVGKQNDLHDIEQNLNLLKPFNISPPALPREAARRSGARGGVGERGRNLPTYRLLIPSKHDQQAQHYLKSLNIPPDRKIIGLHPGSAPHFAWKRWPIENFAAVGKELINKHNAQILIFGGQNEQALKQQLHSMLGEHSSVIHTTLLTTATIIKHCLLFISNDSGLMHIAAAVGTRTLGLFGPTNEHKTGPRGPHTSTLRAPNTQPVYDTQKNYKLGAQSHMVLLSLKPQMVLDNINI